MNIRPIPLKLRTLALLCLLPLAASALQAAVFYVDGTNGDNANTGTTWAKAKKTIQGGVDVATDGDAVVVAPGTYTGEATRPSPSTERNYFSSQGTGQTPPSSIARTPEAPFPHCEVEDEKVDLRLQKCRALLVSQGKLQDVS